MRFSILDRRTNLEKEIDKVLLEMSVLARDSKEYSAMLDNLEKLCKAKSPEAKSFDDRTRRLSLDTIAVVAGNLLGIMLILGFEKENVITTKALSFVLKGRV